MTRLLREHPPIEAELGAGGTLVAIRWNGRREVVEVCNRWRVEITDPEATIAESRWRWVPVAGAAVTGEEGAR